MQWTQEEAAEFADIVDDAYRPLGQLTYVYPETEQQVVDRVSIFLQSVERDALVCTHEGIIRAAARVMGKPYETVPMGKMIEL